MKSLGLEFKVGLFVIIAMATLGYMLFVLNPESFDRENYVEYYTTLANARGIVPKTHVRTNGVVVGRVKSVELGEDGTKITMEVLDKVQIPKGSKLELRSKGILGDVFIEIIRVPGEEMLKNGEKIPINENNIGMEELVGILGGIAQDVKKVTSTLAEVIGDENGKRSVKEIVNNVTSFTQQLDTILKENRDDVRKTVSGLAKTAETLKETIADNRQALKEIIANVRSATGDLRQFSKNMNDLANEENRLRIERIIASLDASMVDVKDTAKNIKLVSDKVQKGEGTIGRLVNDDALVNDLQGALKDLREVLAPATKLVVNVDYHGEVRQDESTQHYFNMLFKTRPDKYFLIGLTDVEERVVTTKTEAIDDVTATGTTPAYKTTRETIRDEKQLRFNLQYARRWYFTTLRFGLFETTGGIASDLHFFDDRFKLTFEAFDWKSKDNEKRNVAHLKAYASALFFSHIYALIGVDDITRRDPITTKVNKKLNYFAGAGMSFDDNDLKAIFGTAAVVSR